MTNSSDWLIANAPGFSDLSPEELDAISNFGLFWSLFEAKILNTRASSNAIYDAVKQWHAAEPLDSCAYAPEIEYLRSRYYENGIPTRHFVHLHLNESDPEKMAVTVLDGSNNDPCDLVAAILIIIYRYRNNLFHGTKWQYNLADQKQNFLIANDVLMKILVEHGNLNTQ